ncbi:Peroxisomal membrane signal receptor PTS1, partial [Dinochytrium kinnereticum]
WANEFGQFQHQPLPRGSTDAEFEAAFRAAAGPAAKDWGAEFVHQHGAPVHSLDEEFERMEQIYSSAKIADPLEAAWSEQFSHIDSIDVKGKGKATEEANWEAEFSKIKDSLTTDGEMDPEMMEKFNDLWKTLADRDNGSIVDPASNSWASEFDEFNTTGSLLDPDPVTAPLAPYHFEENNPYLAHADPFAEGLKLVSEGANLSAAALAFEAAAQRDPQNSDAWMHLGRVQAENEKEGPAIAALQRSVQENPTNLPALLSLAVSYTNESQELQSYATLERWINAKYPSVMQSHPPPTSGTISTPQELHQRTSNLFLEAVRLGPSAAAVQSPAGMKDIDPEVQEGLGVLFYIRGEFDKA